MLGVVYGSMAGGGERRTMQYKGMAHWSEVVHLEGTFWGHIVVMSFLHHGFIVITMS